jgi:WS/DGAT C-terminal domain
VITDGMGLNMTVMSYWGHLDFGIVADREQMRDVWSLISWLRESLQELLPADVRQPAHGDGRATADAREAATANAGESAPTEGAAAAAPAEDE